MSARNVENLMRRKEADMLNVGKRGKSTRSGIHRVSLESCVPLKTSRELKKRREENS